MLKLFKYVLFIFKVIIDSHRESCVVVVVVVVGYEVRSRHMHRISVIVSFEIQIIRFGNVPFLSL